MIITIDGQAATKKSPTAYLLAQRLKFKHISSGLVYRAAAVEVVESREKGQNIVGERYRDVISKLRFGSDTLQWLGSAIEKHSDDGVRTYTEKELTNPKVTECASYISLSHIVREEVEKVLKREVRDCDVVTDGRDTGTVLFPDADLKFFFKADFESRVRWRHEYEGTEHGESLGDVRIALKGRDAESFWIQEAPGAIVIDVENMTVNEIANHLAEKYVVPYRLGKIGQPLID